MVANLWTYCHFKGLVNEKDVDVVHLVDRENGITLRELKLIKKYMSDFSYWPYRFGKSRYDVKDIWAMEMKILESLNDYLMDAGIVGNFRIANYYDMNDVNMIQSTGGIVNDTYKMDVLLVHLPYLIALACILIASVYKEKDATAWFEELNVDMNVVKNISMEILDFYDDRGLVTSERLTVAFGKLES